MAIAVSLSIALLTSSVRALAQAADAKPTSPVNVAAVAHDSSVEVTFSAPTGSGGSPISSYTVTSIPAAATVTVPATTTDVVVGGLTNGVAYTFTVHATNSAGDSPETGPTAPVTPTASSENAVVSFGWGRGVLVAILALALAVAWALLFIDRRRVDARQEKLMEVIGADAEKRTSRLTANERHVLIKASRGTTGLTRTSLALGLLSLVGIALIALLIGDASQVNEAVKTFFAGLLTVFTTVIGFYFGSKTAADAAQSTSAAGPAAAVPASGPGSGVRPDSPRNVSAQSNGGVVTVTFDPPANQGDSPVTSYTATTTGPTVDDKKNVTTMKTNVTAPIEFRGLQIGAAYTFTVYATNAAGDSNESDPSSAITVK